MLLPFLVFKGLHTAFHNGSTNLPSQQQRGICIIDSLHFSVFLMTDILTRREYFSVVLLSNSLLIIEKSIFISI